MYTHQRSLTRRHSTRHPPLPPFFLSTNILPILPCVCVPRTKRQGHAPAANAPVLYSCTRVWLPVVTAEPPLPSPGGTLLRSDVAMTEHTQCSHILEAALTAAAGNRHHMIRMPQMPLERLCDKRLQHARPRSKRWDRPQHQIASFRRIPLEFGTRCQPRAVEAAYAACIHRWVSLLAVSGPCTRELACENTPHALSSQPRSNRRRAHLQHPRSCTSTCRRSALAECR